MNSISWLVTRIHVLCLLCVPMLLLTGCWDRKEVNSLCLITAAAIDKKADNSIELSVQVFIPRSTGQQGMTGNGGGSGSSSGQTFVRSAEGLTIADAMLKLQEKLSRVIFWGHTEIFIISSELAKDGIHSHIDFMVRHPQVRQNAYIFISKNKAKRLLELIPRMERSSSEVLRGQVKSGIGLTVTLKDLVQRLNGEAGAVGLPWVEELPPELGQTGLQTIPYITGTAIFKKDKMVGRINDVLTRGVLWLRNEIKLSMITVSPEEAEGLVSLKLLRGQTQLIPKIENGQWKITLKTVTEDDILQNGTNLQLMAPKFAKMLEKDLAVDIQDRVEKTLDQVQGKMKADIFGFADAFHRKYPREWNKMKDRWDEVFPEVKVSYNIRAIIRRPGMSTAPAGLQKKEVRQ
jgi:spore germination protein KC